MKRRDFLAGSMSALAVSTVQPGGVAEVLAPRGAAVTAAEMQHFLTELDGAMDRIARDPGGGRFIRKLLPRPPEPHEALVFRQEMRALLLTGNFGDLSTEGQVHPGMQKRLRYSAPEMDAAMQTLVEHVASLSPASRKRLKDRLKTDPDVAAHILEAIDLEAASVGVPQRRRAQLRVMGRHILRRLKQSPDLLIDEYVTKCQRLSACDGVEAAQTLMAARVGEAAYKARLEKAEEAARKWQKLNVADEPIGYERLGASDDDERSDGWYRTALWLLGIGAGSTALGLALLSIDGDGEGAAGGIGLVLGVTVGPILLAIGLVTLLIGAIIDTTDGSRDRNVAPAEGERRWLPGIERNDGP